MSGDDLSLLFGPVSSSAPEPLYEQVTANVKREIRAGRLAADQPLPSTRGLAAGLRVSVITIARAYEELEKEGIVYSRQGQRTFVSRSAQEVLRLERSAPMAHLLSAVEAARAAGLPDEALIDLLKAALTRRGKK